MILLVPIKRKKSKNRISTQKINVMKKVNLLAVAVMLLGLGFATTVNANSHSPVGNENTISAQIDLDGGIIDPDEEEDEKKDNG